MGVMDGVAEAPGDAHSQEATLEDQGEAGLAQGYTGVPRQLADVADALEGVLVAQVLHL